MQPREKSSTGNRRTALQLYKNKDARRSTLHRRLRYGIGHCTLLRTDAIQERLEGKGSLALYEGDRVKTGSGSQA